MASAGIVDAQSVKGADTVGAGSRGYDAGKKVNGRKRHIVVDTLGLLIVVLVTAANLQDRDGGRRILDRARMAMPSIALVWATVATRASWLPGSPGIAGSCSRSCENPRGSGLSKSCRAVGWWNEPCPGGCAGDDSTKTELPAAISIGSESARVGIVSRSAQAAGR